MKYRVGLPGWRTAARLGARLYFRVDVHFDREAGRYWASSNDLDGLVVEGGTLDELQSETLSAASELLDLQFGGSRHPKAKARLRQDLSIPSAT